MDEATKDYFYSIFFRLEMYRRSGEEFQIFFSDLMFLTDPHFIKVAPFGGDGGNDGCVANKGHYYQIYAPKPTTPAHQTHKTVLQKSVTDFEKLNTHWNGQTGLPNISEYYFVYNDRFQGIPPDIITTLAALKSTYNLDNSECIHSAIIENYFDILTEKQKLKLLNRLPINEVPFTVDPSALGKLLQHLSNQNINSLGFLEIDVPIWDEKIKFNGISQNLDLKLKTNSLQGHRVRDYLKGSKSTDSQDIAQQINNIYKESKIHLPDTLENSADMRYFWIVDRLIPTDIFQTASIPVLQAFRNASEIVLAHYFDTCDVYDNPNQLHA